jgi:SAM-dependent MidA family methyltransferase
LDPQLLAAIVREIRNDGPIPFDRFMEIALYDPARGYYARETASIGREGDFYTASDVGTIFGQCIARHVVEMDRALGRPEPFLLLETGAGRGLLARDVLDALGPLDPGARSRILPFLVDRSPAMRRVCAATVPEAEVADAGPSIARDGCSIAIELFDALPVRRVRREGGKVVEVLVDADAAGGLIERTGEPALEVLRRVERYGAVPEDGNEAEIALGLEEQLERLQAPIRRGFVLVIDYGYRAEELYGPRHRRGTLLAYHRHRASEDYLRRVGEQDLTAHVNFSALEEHARALGLDPILFTTQDRFLIASGILAEEDPADRSLASVRRRLQAKQLIHPEGMGRAFRVLLLAKGLDAPPSLSALRDPFSRTV